MKTKKLTIALAIIGGIIAGGFLTLATITSAAPSLAKKLAGRFLMQAEGRGELWYVDPVSLERYAINDPSSCFQLVKDKKLGITNSDLNQIPLAWKIYTSDDDGFEIKFPSDWKLNTARAFGQIGYFLSPKNDPGTRPAIAILPNGEFDRGTPSDFDEKAKISKITFAGTLARQESWNIFKIIKILDDKPNWSKQNNRIEILYDLNDPKLIDQILQTFHFSTNATKIKIFFCAKSNNEDVSDNVIEFMRTIPATQTVGSAALNEMLKGPTMAEAEVARLALPSGTKLLSLNIKNQTAYADFSKELQNYGGGSCSVAAMRAQIEKTLKQFPTVKNVVISVDGKTEGVLQP